MATTRGSETSPLLGSQQSRRPVVQLQRMSSYNPQSTTAPAPLRKMATVQHGSMVSTPVSGLKGQPRSAVLYSTGRSFSITTTHLEPTYPWDFDLDNDDLDEDVDEDDEDDDDEEYEDAEDDLAGEQYMGDEEEEYQHPSLETRKSITLIVAHLHARGHWRKYYIVKTAGFVSYTEKQVFANPTCRVLNFEVTCSEGSGAVVSGVTKSCLQVTTKLFACG